MSENLNITNREDIFLAKIAGRDVDISTMTPPVANGVHEKLLDEIADRIDDATKNALPEIEDGDNGKVLGVSGGQYALVNGGGGGSSGLVVHMTWDAHAEVSVLDKTWQEIWDAFSSGSSVVIVEDELEGYALACVVTAMSEEGYTIVVGSGGPTSYYTAESADGYPHSYNPEDE